MASPPSVVVEPIHDLFRLAIKNARLLPNR